MMQMTMERREIDHAMSWLSTLGGAFSALGEEFQQCVGFIYFINMYLLYIKN